MGRGDIDEDPFVYVRSGADETAMRPQRDILEFNAHRRLFCLPL